MSEMYLNADPNIEKNLHNALLGIIQNIKNVLYAKFINSLQKLAIDIGVELIISNDILNNCTETEFLRVINQIMAQITDKVKLALSIPVSDYIRLTSGDLIEDSNQNDT